MCNAQDLGNGCIALGVQFDNEATHIIQLCVANLPQEQNLTYFRGLYLGRGLMCNLVTDQSDDSARQYFLHGVALAKHQAG